MLCCCSIDALAFGYDPANDIVEHLTRLKFYWGQINLGNFGFSTTRDSIPYCTHPLHWGNRDFLSTITADHRSSQSHRELLSLLHGTFAPILCSFAWGRADLKAHRGRRLTRDLERDVPVLFNENNECASVLSEIEWATSVCSLALDGDATPNHVYRWSGKPEEHGEEILYNPHY
jgi:hypothetical protein